MPLCVGHLYEAWRIARNAADKTNNRETHAVIVQPEGPPKKVERPVSRLGWIYYLRIGDSIKVGYASKLLSRLRSYPPGAEFLYAHRGTKTDEKVAHSMLYLWRCAGREWFEDRPEVTDYIEKQYARYGPMADPRIKQPDSFGYLEPKPIRFVRG